MLAIEGLRKTFPPAKGWQRLLMRTASDEPTEALRGIDLVVSAGEILGLVGPNGAGKTTLFRIIATLLEPSDGRVRVADYDVTKAPREARERIGLVLDGDRGFYHRLTGLENLAFFGVMQGLPPDAARQQASVLMERFDLAGRDRRVFGYSTGMRIRLAVARSVMAQPSLVILDEPTRSLDASSAREVLTLIRDLAGKGRTVVMATHRLNELDAVCSRAALLVGGRIVFDGPPARLAVTADELGLGWNHA